MWRRCAPPSPPRPCPSLITCNVSWHHLTASCLRFNILQDGGRAIEVRERERDRKEMLNNLHVGSSALSCCFFFFSPPPSPKHMAPLNLARESVSAFELIHICNAPRYLSCGIMSAGSYWQRGEICWPCLWKLFGSLTCTISLVEASTVYPPWNCLSFPLFSNICSFL